MITIKINGNEHEVEEGTRLVNAIEDAGYDISHRCGGKAMCTTCRVEIEVESYSTPYALKMTDAEISIFEKNDLLGSGLRLSCQLLASEGLKITVGMPVSDAEWNEPGPRPADEIEPVI